MIVDALVFGTARLTGGASAPASRRLLERCLAAGVRHVDTAPSYGIGTAEAVVGAASVDRPDVRLTAKLGSVPPSHAVLRTWARAAKAWAVGRRSPLQDDWAPAAAIAYGIDRDWDAAALGRQLERSREALRRDRIDVVLLHELRVDALDAAMLGWLRHLSGSGRVGAAGVASGGVVDPTLLAAAPRDLVTQAALTPKAFTGQPMLPAFVHSIANTVLYLDRTDPAFAQWLARASALIPAEVADRRTAAIAAGYARLHAKRPDLRLIFASIDPARLSALLAAIAHIDAACGAAAFLPVAVRSTSPATRPSLQT